MGNKNSKSNSYIVREAEMIIEDYLEKREMSEIERYKVLKEKYERLKTLEIVIFIVTAIGILINIVIK